MASNSGDVSRKTWDVEAFAQRARDREEAEKNAEQERIRARKAARDKQHIDGDPFAPTRAWLRKREHHVDLEAKVGVAEVITSVQGGGFYCDVCKTTMKDSKWYLNHINSRRHQKMLGMSMRVKRSSAEEVRAAFKLAIQKRKAQRSSSAGGRKSEAARHPFVQALDGTTGKVRDIYFTQADM